MLTNPCSMRIYWLSNNKTMVWLKMNFTLFSLALINIFVIRYWLKKVSCSRTDSINTNDTANRRDTRHFLPPWSEASSRTPNNRFQISLSPSLYFPLCMMHLKLSLHYITVYVYLSYNYQGNLFKCVLKQSVQPNLYLMVQIGLSVFF